MLFDHAITISSLEDLNNFMKKVINLDLATNYYLKKPSSSWVLAGLTNLQICIYRLENTPIGAKVILPDYIKDSKSIVAMINSRKTSKPYKDNLCFFRCLAYHFKHGAKGLDRATTKFLHRFEGYMEQSFEKGVNLSHIPLLETCFSTAINVYDLKEDKSVEVIYLSRLSFPGQEAMHLNLYKNHFSYISKLSSYAKKYQCNRFLTNLLI